MEDLWPTDIGFQTELKAPVVILREQAAKLGSKTQNLIIADVIQIPGGDGDERPFGYKFVLIAPALGSFGFELFHILYGIDLYPVTLTVDPDIALEVFPDPRLAIGVNSEEELMKWLKKIFSAKKTKRIIDALQAQIAPEQMPTHY